MGNIYINQPMDIELDSKIDASGASVLLIKMQINGGATQTFVAALKEGSDSILEYSFEANEINALGLGKWWVCVDGKPGEPYHEQVYTEGQG